MWLAEHTNGVAWELLGPDQPEDDRLDRDFSEVRRTRSTSPVPIRTPDSDVDVVVLHSLLRTGDDADVHELLRTFRQRLRPGGYIVFAVSNSTRGRTLVRRVMAGLGAGSSGQLVKDGLRADLRTVKRWLERAGFASARCYLVGGSSTRPTSLVPASRDAIVAHQRTTAPGPLPSWLRGSLATLGLGALFYPRIIAFGYR